MNIHNFWCIV